MTHKKQSRSLRNSARLNPKTHLVVVLFVTVVVLMAAALSGFLFHFYLQYVLETLRISGSISQETVDIMDELFRDLLWLIAIIESIILFSVALVSLNYAFRVTGAEFALARHIRENLRNGKWEPIQLRKKDALISISDELNKLSEQQASGSPGTS